MMGNPSTTARRPMTIDEITMVTPTDRSIPAVKMTKVCPMARMPTIVTWVSTVEKLVAVTKWEKLTAAPSSTPSISTTNGTIVGYEWRKRWTR
jgi:hypothetical protein